MKSPCAKTITAPVPPVSSYSIVPADRSTSGMSLSYVSGSCACEEFSDGLGDRHWLVVQTSMGDAYHPVVGELQGGVADAVALEGGSGAVEGVAVELDDEL